MDKKPNSFNCSNKKRLNLVDHKIMEKKRILSNYFTFHIFWHILWKNFYNHQSVKIQSKWHSVTDVSKKKKKLNKTKKTKKKTTFTAWLSLMSWKMLENRAISFLQHDVTRKKEEKHTAWLIALEFTRLTFPLSHGLEARLGDLNANSSNFGCNANKLSV